jgi:hypothetical protein
VRIEVRAERTIEIEIPDTELFGRVVDERGQEVENARVSLATPSGSAFSERSDADGGFSFRGFPPEPVEVVARVREAGRSVSSDTVMMPVHEALPAGPVELVLRHSTRVFSGTVVSPRGAVAGAQVQVEPAVPGLGPPTIARTELDGSFTAEVPERADALRLTVLPPGFAFETFVVSAAQEPAVLEVDELGGSLEVAWDSGDDVFLDGRQVIVLREGQPVASHLLLAWQRGQGHAAEPGRFTLPRMSLGTYGVCWLDPRTSIGALRAGGSWLDALEGCASGYLGYGETLRLEPSRLTE